MFFGSNLISVPFTCLMFKVLIVDDVLGGLSIGLSAVFGLEADIPPDVFDVSWQLHLQDHVLMTPAKVVGKGLSRAYSFLASNIVFFLRNTNFLNGELFFKNFAFPEQAVVWSFTVNTLGCKIT
ncbi:hypothetical protein ACFFRR_004239 [Megaselia abdita]